MKNTIRLTESELTNLVRKIVNENMHENDIYSGVMDVIRNSNVSTQETIDVLQMIIDEMESSRRVRRGAESRFRNSK